MPRWTAGRIIWASLADLVEALARRGGMRPLRLRTCGLGCPCEDQAAADARIPHLLRCPAAVRFLSMEPLLGAVDLSAWLPASPWFVATCGDCGHAANSQTFVEDRGYDDADMLCPKCFGSNTGRRDASGIGWAIAGGDARPIHPDWARSIRDQCAAAGVPFFFKQWGEWAPCSVAQQVAEASTVADGVDLVAPDGKGLGSSRVRAEFRVGPHPHAPRRLSRRRHGGTRQALRQLDGDRQMARLYSASARKLAGRLLDGVTHDGFPTPASAR